MSNNDKTIFWILAGIAGVGLATTLANEPAPEIADTVADDTSDKTTTMDNVSSVKHPPKYEKEFARVEKSLENGLYSNAVMDACKILCQSIRDKSGIDKVDGVDLINQVFGKNALLRFNIYPNQPNLDLHNGYVHLCCGVLGGFRNVHAHANLDLTEAEAKWQIQFIVYLINAVMNKTVLVKKTET